jgi:hypothetical protein
MKVQKPSATEIVKLMLGEFGDKDISALIVNDDGGPVIEIRSSEEESSKSIRDLIPLKYQGWRVVVMSNNI